MKRKLKQLSILITLLILFQGNIIYARPTSVVINETVLIIDNEETTSLPKRFRIVSDLNISGSQQFTPTQLINITKKINNPNLYIVDLRQEAHGFLNDMAVSYHNNVIYPFECFDSKETLEMERNLFGRIKLNNKVNLYKLKGDFIKSINVNAVSLEPDLTKQINVNYELFPVRDGDIPLSSLVDRFIEFTKNISKDSHIHFHCKEGEGRTTTFMSMYQIMNNTNDLTLQEILKQQLNIGGIDIVSGHPKRATFIKQFYNYVEENKSSNYAIPYSQWSINETLVS